MKDYIKPTAEIVRFNTEAITDDVIDDIIGGEGGVGSGGDDSWD